MPLVRQQIHQRSVHPGPLVLRTALLKYLAPTTDRDRTVWTQLAYRFNGRTAQPLGPNTAPGCDEPTSRCQTTPSMWTLGSDKPVIPGVAFIRWAMAIPLSYHRITKSYFRTCSTRRCHSQSTLCLCALRMVSNHSEVNFERLRYTFGGDRPSQTPHQTLSPHQIMVLG